MAQQVSERNTTVPECEALISGLGVILWKRVMGQVDPDSGPYDECENPAQYFFDRRMSTPEQSYRLPICSECAEILKAQTVNPVMDEDTDDLIQIPIEHTPMDGHEFVPSAELVPQTITSSVLGTQTTIMFQSCLLCLASYRLHKEACELYYAHTGQLPKWAPWFEQNKDWFEQNKD